MIKPFACARRRPALHCEKRVPSSRPQGIPSGEEGGASAFLVPMLFIGSGRRETHPTAVGSSNLLTCI
jgi:hypothetical protein